MYRGTQENQLSEVQMLDRDQYVVLWPNQNKVWVCYCTFCLIHQIIYDVSMVLAPKTTPWNPAIYLDLEYDIHTDTCT